MSTFNNVDPKSIDFNNTGLSKVNFNNSIVWEKRATVTYRVDSDISYTEMVKVGASCLSPTTFTPSKSGWTFVGWKTHDAASADVLTSKIMGNEPISLYAVFAKEITVYTYDEQEWTQSGNVYYNNGNVLPAEIEAFECDGTYSNFRGYKQFDTLYDIEDYIYPSDEPDVYENDILELTEDTYLVALYSHTVTLSYYNNSTTKQTKTGTRYIECYSHSAVNPSFTISAATKSGWSFRGWGTSTTANASVVYSTISGRTFTSNATIYGLYYQTIYLYYNGNGSTGGSVSTQSGTRYYNAYGTTDSPTFTLASNGFSRTGHNFNGWNLGAVGATITLSSSTTAYAQWTAINYYFDINGADNGLVDVYINGSLVASGVSDYYQQHPYGTTYEIKNIRANSGYTYNGVSGGSLSGTITGTTVTTLSFSIAFTSKDFGYTGGTQSFTVPVSGTYKLEVWGAQGHASRNWNAESVGTPGYGGYSYGNIALSQGQTLYIVVGGAGSTSGGGYNGGGSGSGGYGSGDGAGGGATHIGTFNNTLAGHGSASGLYIVAGGGGGTGYHNGDSQGLNGGNGGGTSGTAGTGSEYYDCDCTWRHSHTQAQGGTQSSGGAGACSDCGSHECDGSWTADMYECADSGSFGKGANGRSIGFRNAAGGGGGGYYGGGGGLNGGGAGGSGYIGGVSSGSMSNGQRSGDGYARITLL